MSDDTTQSASAPGLAPRRDDEPALLDVASEIATDLYRAPTDDATRATRAPEWHPLPGELVDGRYRLVRALGSGGMGSVWLAEAADGTHVALKWLRSGRRLDPEARERFARESRIVLELDHPHVVRGLDEGVLPDGRAYLAMEYAEGRTLDVLLRERGRLTFPEVVRLASQLADALVAIHARGIVHRDLKAANVVVRGSTFDLAQADVRLLDLGICRDDAIPAGMTLTRAGTVLGTPAYTAPEQLAGARVTPKADLFSLGVLVYKMIAGRLPFGGTTFAEVFRALLASSPPTLRVIAPDSARPDAFDVLVEALLARDPRARPASAAEVRDALAAFTPPERARWPRVVVATSIAIVVGFAVGVALVVGGVAS